MPGAPVIALGGEHALLKAVSREGAANEGGTTSLWPRPSQGGVFCLPQVPAVTSHPRPGSVGDVWRTDGGRHGTSQDDRGGRPYWPAGAATRLAAPVSRAGQDQFPDRPRRLGHIPGGRGGTGGAGGAAGRTRRVGDRWARRGGGGGPGARRGPAAYDRGEE